MIFSGLHYSAYSCPDDIHFVGSEPVPPSKIAWGAGGAYITAHVGEAIINTVKSPWTVGSTAVHAWLLYKFKDFIRRKIASIYSLVCFTQEYRTTFIGLAVLFIASLSLIPLFGGHIYPTFFTAITSFFAVIMTLLTFVGKPKWAALFPMEVFGRSHQTTATAEASAVRHTCMVYGPHEKHKEN